jgi:hypothetical protein
MGGNLAGVEGLAIAWETLGKPGCLGGASVELGQFAERTREDHRGWIDLELGL